MIFWFHSVFFWFHLAIFWFYLVLFWFDFITSGILDSYFCNILDLFSDFLFSFDNILVPSALHVARFWSENILVAN